MASTEDSASSLGKEPLLQIRGLRTYFHARRGTGKAVDGVSLDLGKSETLGIVGESGSGKSVLALSIVGLNPYPASRVVGGSVSYRGENLLSASPERMRQIRGGEIAMVFQDASAALNPLFTIGDQIAEALRAHQNMDHRALRARSEELLRLLRVPQPRDRLANYPHQLSGGMQQRAVSAIALSCRPQVVIADEPTTALDVTVQAAYLELLRDIQKEQQLSIIFITHDFAIVAKICDRVLVMYAGQVVESAKTETLFSDPVHPYSAALMALVLDVRARPRRLASIEGQPPSIYDFAEGCRFRPRCWLYQALDKPDRCREEMPELTRGPTGTSARCHFQHESRERARTHLASQSAAIQAQG